MRFAANDLAGLQIWSRPVFPLYHSKPFATDDYLILGKVVKRLAGDQFHAGPRGVRWLLSQPKFHDLAETVVLQKLEVRKRNDPCEQNRMWPVRGKGKRQNTSPHENRLTRCANLQG